MTLPDQRGTNEQGNNVTGDPVERRLERIEDYMRQSFGEVFARFNSLADQFLTRELYNANRTADQKDVEAIRDEITRQSSSRRWLVSAVLVPMLVATIATVTALLLYAAERGAH